MKRERIRGITVSQLINSNRYQPLSDVDSAYKFLLKGKNKWERRLIILQNEIMNRNKNSAQ